MEVSDGCLDCPQTFFGARPAGAGSPTVAIRRRWRSVGLPGMSVSDAICCPFALLLRYGVYYTQKKPLTIAALDDLPGI